MHEWLIKYAWMHCQIDIVWYYQYHIPFKNGEDHKENKKENSF